MRYAILLIVLAVLTYAVGLSNMFFICLFFGALMVWAWVEDKELQREYDETLQRIERGEDI